MTQDSQQKPARLRPWLRLVFGASVALNLAVAGIVAGSFFRPEKSFKADRPPPMGALLYRELSREDRKILRDAQAGSHAEREGQRRDDADRLTVALKAVPFAPDDVQSLLAEYSQRIEDFQQSVSDLWLDRVTLMGETERADYADRLYKAIMAKPEGKPPHPPKRD